MQTLVNYQVASELSGAAPTTPEGTVGVDSLARPGVVGLANTAAEE